MDATDTNHKDSMGCLAWLAVGIFVLVIVALALTDGQ